VLRPIDCGHSQEVPDHSSFVTIGAESLEEFLRRTGIEIVEKSLSL